MRAKDPKIVKTYISGLKSREVKDVHKYDYDDDGYARPDVYAELDEARRKTEHLSKKYKKAKDFANSMAEAVDWAIRGAKFVQVKHNGGFSMMIMGNWCRANLKGEFKLIEREPDHSAVGAFMDPEDAIKFRLFYG